MSPRIPRLPLQIIGIAALVLASGCARQAVLRGAEAPVIAQPEAETVLEGNLEVVIEDSAQGSRTQHFLILGDRRVLLRFKDGPPPKLITGARVRVTGRWQADATLMVSSIEAL